MAAENMVQAWAEGMAARFHPERAGNMDAVFQFDITGDGGGKWYVAIKDKGVQVAAGEADSPKVTIICSADSWEKLVTRQASAEALYAMGRLHIKGPLYLAQQFAYIID